MDPPPPSQLMLGQERVPTSPLHKAVLAPHNERPWVANIQTTWESCVPVPANCTHVPASLPQVRRGHQGMNMQRMGQRGPCGCPE